MRPELSDRWVRAFVGEVAVVDTRTPVLFWEDGFPVPRYAFDRADVREDLLRAATGETPTQPWFFLPQGPVSQWYDLELDGRRLPHVAWHRDDPGLGDRLVFSWQPGLVDRWLEEDEEVASHPRDPHTRVDALPSSRHVTVALGGVVLAESERPVLLFETGLPTRYYLPPDDVHLELLTPTDNRSHCPYKGVADRYFDVAGQPDAANIAWCYSSPYPAVRAIKDRVAFYNEAVDLTVDGLVQARPDSPFSTGPRGSGA